MRATTTGNGLTLTVYAGTTGTHLAWDADAPLTGDLLGFAIRRRDAKYPNGVFLSGGIGFPGQSHPPGYFLDTSVAPIQAFRWGDYTVYPDTDYRYELVPMYAPWDHLTPGPSLEIAIHTELVTDGAHGVAFNRAVAASQAYERRFDGADPHDDGTARQWLGRGLDEFIQSFIARATGPGDAVDVVIYEYELAEIRDALRAARGRGAEVRIVYHAQPGDDQTAVNLQDLQADGLDDVARPRVTSSICHDKTVVLSRLDAGARTPRAVLTGSTNWTFNGLYYQANVAHTVDDAAVAARYLAIFERLWAGDDQGTTRDWIDANDPVPAASATQVPPVYSPRSDRTDLTYYIDLIGGSQRSLLFMTAFELDPAFLTALAEGGSPSVLRYGLQNTKSSVTGYNRQFNRTFTATGTLRTAVTGFLEESRHGQDGNILVHGKIVLLDFDTARPVLIVGSANFSGASSNDNDENVLVIRDDTRLADIYLCELFRLFDHYRFRYNVTHPDAGVGAPAVLATESTSGEVTPRFELDPTNAWTGRYYDDPTDPHALERGRLSRPTG